MNFERSAFTLVEMVIVVAIVLVLVTLVLPASSQMWRDRRIADAQNTISGMLMTARAQALQADFGESGLFFYVDNNGTQRVVAINQDASVHKEYVNPQTREAWASVFSVVPGKNVALPAPMRVVPRYVVDDVRDPRMASLSNEQKAKATFSPEELANNDVYHLPASNADQAQRHRNFFTMIYSPDGRLQVGRDVLIRDVDSDPDENPGGDVTGLRVPPADPVVNMFALSTNRATPIDPTGRAVTVSNLVIDDSRTAINFPSVDGLMVYDDEQFAVVGGAAVPGRLDPKKQFVVETGQPFYVHRVTGTVVRGPVGETVALAP